MPNYSRLLAILAFVLIAQGCASTTTQRSSGEVIDDAAISTKIKTALLADKTTDGTDIEIEIDKGRVQLNGFADSAEEVARAEEIARSSKGVVSVTNNLQVAEGSRTVGRYLDDKVLVGKVNAALANEDGVRASAIEVEVNRGTVMLGGYVDTAEEVEAAGAATNRVAGVEKLINNIQVR